MNGSSRPPRCFETVNAALRVAATLSDSGAVFVGLDERETWLRWPDLYQRARSAAGALRHLGLRPGDRVAIVVPTSPDFMYAFFGVLLAGAIPAPLPPPVRLGDLAEYHASIARMLAAIGASLVLSDARFHKALAVPLERARPALGCRTVDDLLHDDRGELEEPVDSAGLALIQFSSGSTTDPKAVALTHGQLMAQCAAIGAMMLTAPERPQFGVSWLPLYHDMGLIGPLLTGLCHGRGGLVLIRPEHFLLKPALWLRTISRFRAQHSPAPNFAYALCLKRIRDEEMDGTDLSSWRYALNGAEPVSMDVMRRFAARFSRWGFDPAALTPVYGLAEAALAVSFSAPGEPPHAVAVDPVALASTGEVIAGTMEIASVGRPVPGVDVELRDERGRAVAEGVVGRIFVRGPSVMTGYFRDGDATARVLRDGWLDTGDLGFVIAGELYVSGRVKDVVIIRGANYTAEVFEASLEAIDGLQTDGAAAIGYIPPGGDGEELLVLAERVSRASPANDPLLIAQIHDAILTRTGIRPRHVQLLDPGTLPRTTSGKLRRAEALRRWRSGVFQGNAVAGETAAAATSAPSSAAAAGDRR